MTRTFVDTSALYALLDEDDQEHACAASWMRSAGAEPSRLLTTHTFVAVEAAALIHRRLGVEAVRSLLDGCSPPSRCSRWTTPSTEPGSSRTEPHFNADPRSWTT